MMKRGLLSIMIVFCLLLALLPMTANAEEFYTVTYSVPTGYLAPDADRVHAGNSYALPTGLAAPEGYTFVGWYESPLTNEISLADPEDTVKTGLYLPAGNITLYACYCRTETIDGYYQKTTGEPASSGNKYLIVYESEDKNIAFTNKPGTAGSGASHYNTAGDFINVTITNDKIALTSEVEAIALVIRRVSTGHFSIKLPNGKYLGYNAGTDLKLYDTEYSNNGIDFDALGYFVWNDLTTTDRIFSYSSRYDTIKFFKDDSNLYLYERHAPRTVDYYTTNPLDESECLHKHTRLTGYVAPTCMDIGHTGVLTCDDCGATLQRDSEISALGHDLIANYNYLNEPFYPCEGGLIYYTCSRCDYTEEEWESGTGHNWVFNVEEYENDPDPNKNMANHCYCEKCNSVYLCWANDGPAPEPCEYGGEVGEHSFVAHAEKLPTCTESGHTAYSSCSLCGYCTNYITVEPVSDWHDFTYTVSGNGMHTGNCTRCDYSRTESHAFVDGACVCGARKTPAYMQTASLQDGDVVVIYFPETGESVHSETTFAQFSVDALQMNTVASAFLWTVKDLGDSYLFSNGTDRLSSYAEEDTEYIYDEINDPEELFPLPVLVYNPYIMIKPNCSDNSYDSFGDCWTIRCDENTSQLYLNSTLFGLDDPFSAEFGPVEFYKLAAMGVSELKIDTASLTLYEDIVVNFTASVPEGLTEPYMVIEVGEQSHTIQASREDAQGRLVFEFKGLTPDMMGDNIKATLYATTAGGQLVHYCKPTYSVKQYCTNVMAAYPDNAKLQTLLADMLVYGAATQRFTGHNTDALVTAGLDLTAASEFSDLTATDFARTGTPDANIQWTGAGLECGSQMSMYFTLNTTAGDATSVEVTINGRTTAYGFFDMTVTDESDFGATCRVVFRGISASEYGDVVTAVLKNNGEQVGETLTYSVNSYIYSKQHNTAVENLAQLVQAIYNYGASAKNYLNK